MRKKKCANGTGPMGLPVELEGGEVFESPQTGLGEVFGPKHEAGGVNMSLPEGTTVFSDRLKGPDGKTMAERKKKRDKVVRKTTVALNINPFDVINRNTVNRVIGTATSEEYNDLLVQEMANAVEQYATLPEFEEEEVPKMKNGGKVKKYANGTGLPPELFLLQKIMEGVNTAKNFTPQTATGNRSAFPTVSPADPKGGATGIPPEARMIKQLFEGIQAAKDFTPKTSTGNRSEFPTVSTGVDNKPAFDDTPGPAGAKPTEGFTSALSLLGGPTGTMISAIAPLATTLLDRLGDRRNPNFYEQFGEDALNSNSLSMQSAGGTRDAQIRQNQLSMAGQRNANRGRSRSVNTLNVLDAASTASGREQNMAAQNQYFGNMSRLFTERAGLQNQRDRMKMQGAETAFTNDTADRDNFWTQLSTSLQSLGMGMEQSELMRNKRRVASQIDISKVLGLDFLKNG